MAKQKEGLEARLESLEARVKALEHRTRGADQVGQKPFTDDDWPKPWAWNGKPGVIDKRTKGWQPTPNGWAYKAKVVDNVENMEETLLPTAPEAPSPEAIAAYRDWKHKHK